MPSEPGDPVAILHDRSVNESKRLDLRALVNTLKFNDFRKNGIHYARQLVAVTKLLDEPIQSPDALSGSRPLTHDLSRAVVDNKSTLSSRPHTTPTVLPYANAL